MRVGIDISQTAFEGTGVSNYLLKLVEALLKIDKENEYVLFFSSLRRNPNKKITELMKTNKKNVCLRRYYIPPLLLDLLWNKLHILKVDKFIGKHDVFISSDWTQPPSNSKKISIIYDLIVFKHSEETHDRFEINTSNLSIVPNIVSSQKRRLKWVRKECDKIICISESTKKDVEELLKIEPKRIDVIYPGI